MLAKIFDCPAFNMEDFGNKVLDKDIATANKDTSDWEEKLKPFLTQSVEKNISRAYRKLLKVLNDKTARSVFPTISKIFTQNTKTLSS